MLPIEIMLRRNTSVPPISGLDSQVVTTGVDGIAPNRTRGYSSSLVAGSIVDGASNIYGGAAILEFNHYEGGDLSEDHLLLKIAGSQANSGWTSIQFDGGSTPSILHRSAADHDISGGETSWTWYEPAGNPFGGSGTVRTVTFI